MTAKATINMLKQKSLPICIISLLIAGIFVLSFFLYGISKHADRRTFIFSVSSDIQSGLPFGKSLKKILLNMKILFSEMLLLFIIFIFELSSLLFFWLLEFSRNFFFEDFLEL